MKDLLILVDLVVDFNHIRNEKVYYVPRHLIDALRRALEEVRAKNPEL